MDTNKRAISLLKKIWEDNDLDAVELFRKIILSEDLILYSEKEEDFNYRPLFYHGEPIVHGYSLSPLANRIDIERLKSSIGKNDIIGFSVYTDNLIEMFCDDSPIKIHLLSGLIYKVSGYHKILFPYVMRTGHHCIVSNGDVVEYITAVDYRHHYGEVRNIEENKVWIKEYAGHCFDYDGCKLLVQDSYIDTMVCIPLDACAVLHKDDYHIEDMRHASTIRVSIPREIAHRDR